jgi:hypothetical protein
MIVCQYVELLAALYSRCSKCAHSVQHLHMYLRAALGDLITPSREFSTFLRRIDDQEVLSLQSLGQLFILYSAQRKLMYVVYVGPNVDERMLLWLATLS